MRVGQARCYFTAPDLFEPDDIGDGYVIGDGTVPPGQEGQARLAVANCPERAITIDEDDDDEEGD
ncbi:MAG: ferredoxin [Actinobacteria bacterium]|nr:ferredoxin [Actinomycetota bacterium]